MNFRVICIGSLKEKEWESIIQDYTKRIGRFHRFEIIEIKERKEWKALSVQQRKQEESAAIIDSLTPGYIQVLLDEKGKEYSSTTFAHILQQWMNRGAKGIEWIVGGPYGFPEELYQRIGDKIALSRLTFTHDMARVLIVEQLYRALTILHNIPYHHD
ncbi:MAG: 23S rRNA (pseudouridine(1915)-N(3))-methyltransferase RlmH [Candidatus Kuenenia stuttgartiensis]|nr:23S rRNA (pseudouridine(1915)-N(3))-methyltransferase RlmH [Candidatus Kuenenia stuttgartiensis]MCZ2443821.1 23S rRNA (pseudouridine(1915)-N(3))-methyltransferase RlmH [Flavobacteriales bacterium]